VISARIPLRASDQTGVVTVALFNVDRLDRLSLEFQSTAIDEPVLEDSFASFSAAIRRSFAVRG
jgi:hypothetical protein